MPDNGPDPSPWRSLDLRVSRLEDFMKEVRAKLARIEPMLARMDERMSRFATKDDLAAVARDVAELRGRVANIPTPLQLLGFVIAIFIASGILRYVGH